MPYPQQHQQRPPLAIALSGLSSTGKSTIASHLPSIFPAPRYALTTFHVDDFYKPQTELPLREGLLDWDCVGSLDWARLEDAVRKWKDDGEEVKEGNVNPQPTECIDGDMQGGGGGRGGITKKLVSDLRAEVRATLAEEEDNENGSESGSGEPRRILLLDGFLLFTPSVPMSFRCLLDLKILLRAPYAEAKKRREARSGYSTMEGWWEDPPGYFDHVVWPNYREENRGFFVGGDVDGVVDEEARQRERVRVGRVGREGGLGEMLAWVVGEVKDVLIGEDEKGA